MKAIARKILYYAFGLFLLTLIVGGFHINDQPLTLIYGGIVLAVLTTILRPVLDFFSLPLRIGTLGFFSIIVDALILYLLTLFVPQITLTAFRFSGSNIYGFIIPAIAFNTFFAYVVSAALLTGIVSFVYWLSE